MDDVRGVYTIESLEQMLQKNFRGWGDLTSNQGGMFQVHEILSVDSQANCKNCCHQMAEFKAKMHQIQNRLSYSAPPDPLAGFKGPTSKGGGGMTGEGRAGGARPVCLLVLTILATGLEGRGRGEGGREKGERREGT